MPGLKFGVIGANRSLAGDLDYQERVSRECSAMGYGGYGAPKIKVPIHLDPSPTAQPLSQGSQPALFSSHLRPTDENPELASNFLTL